MVRALFIDIAADLYDLHGVYSLAGVLRHNDIEAHFARSRDPRKLLEAVRNVRPDLLLYSSLVTDVRKYLAFDGFVKNYVNVRSIIGGPGVTFDPLCFRGSTIDAACIGEGEFALVDFIRSGFKGGRNIFLQGEDAPTEFYPLVDPDKLPFPDRSIVYRKDTLVRDMPSKQFISGRGCPYECSYCFNHEFNRMFKACGPVVRKKSVNYLFDEIRGVRDAYPLKHIVFNDDTFIIDRAWFFEFAARFPREIGMSYTCNIRANLMDDAMARALKDSGCAGVNWSIESGSDEIRNNVLKRHMSREAIMTAAKALTKQRIPYRIGNMVGVPSETWDDMCRTVELNIAVKPALATAAIFTPFPGLAITHYVIDHGYCDAAVTAHMPANMFTRSVMKMGVEENRMVQRMAYLFPFFVGFPRLYRGKGVRAFLLRMPVSVLRAAYHLFYAFKMMRMYRVRSSWMLRLRLAGRYIRMLFS